jgi:hypothetical protein
MTAPKTTASPALEIVEVWVNPKQGSNLLAKVAVGVPRWGATIHACSIVKTKAGGFFVLPPGIPMMRDGVALKDDAGKVKYSPAVVFSRDTGRRFSDAVLAVLRRSHSRLFEDVG